MARARTYRNKAIVVDHRARLSEKDEILTLLLEGGERVSAIGKGALKPGGRLAARVELFSESDFLLAHGRSLDIISEATLVNAHRALRGDLDRVSAASVVCEVASHTSFEDAADPYLYPICSRALTACEEAEGGPRLGLVAAAYAFKVLAHEGWRPDIDSCVACGDAAVSFFSCQAGGTLCASCARDVAGAEPIDGRQIGWLKTLLHARFDELVSMPIDQETSAWLVSLVHRWCATHLDCRLRSFEFLAGV